MLIAGAPRDGLELTAWVGRSLGLRQCFVGRTVLGTLEPSHSVGISLAKQVEQPLGYNAYRDISIIKVIIYAEY